MFNPLSAPSVPSLPSNQPIWVEGINDPIPNVHSGGKFVDTLPRDTESDHVCYNPRYLTLMETLQRLISGDCLLMSDVNPDILNDILARPNVSVEDIGDGRPCLSWVKLEWIPCTASMLHSIGEGSWLLHVPTNELWQCEVRYDPQFNGIRLILDNGEKRSAIDDYYCELAENLGWTPIYWLTEEKAATGEWLYHVD